MNSFDLAAFIKQYAVDAQILPMESETLTVASAADALGVQPEQIIKSVLFLADRRPILVITNGTARIHRKHLADVLQLSRRQVKMASGEEVLAVTGYAIGAVPPFGHPNPLQTLLDQGVLEQEIVYGGGGEINALMRVPVSELQRVTAAETAALSEESEAGG
jgi:prolyl-tRNA editing enzyme YbaK/EbsC (Cys-tRNA(Pro) deacylase)